MGETAEDLVRRLYAMFENEFPRLGDVEQTIVLRKLLRARKELNSVIRKLTTKVIAA